MPQFSRCTEIQVRQSCGAGNGHSYGSRAGNRLCVHQVSARRSLLSFQGEVVRILQRGNLRIGQDHVLLFRSFDDGLRDHHVKIIAGIRFTALLFLDLIQGGGHIALHIILEGFVLLNTGFLRLGLDLGCVLAAQAGNHVIQVLRAGKQVDGAVDDGFQRFLVNRLAGFVGDHFRSLGIQCVQGSFFGFLQGPLQVFFDELFDVFVNVLRDLTKGELLVEQVSHMVHHRAADALDQHLVEAVHKAGDDLSQAAVAEIVKRYRVGFERHRQEADTDPFFGFFVVLDDVDYVFDKASAEHVCQSGGIDKFIQDLAADGADDTVHYVARQEVPQADFPAQVLHIVVHRLADLFRQIILQVLLPLVGGNVKRPVAVIRCRCRLGLFLRGGGNLQGRRLDVPVADPGRIVHGYRVVCGAQADAHAGVGGAAVRLQDRFRPVPGGHPSLSADLDVPLVQNFCQAFALLEVESRCACDTHGHVVDQHRRRTVFPV